MSSGPEKCLPRSERTAGHVTLGDQIVEFIWLDFLDDPNQAAGIRHVSMMEN